MDEAKVSELIAAATRLVDAAKLPADLRAAAFAKAIDLLAAGDSTPRATGRSSASEVRRAGTVEAGPSGSLDAAARSLNLDRAILDAVVGVEDGQPVIHVPPSALESKARPAMRQLVLVLTAVRQGGGWEDQTDAELIKKQLNTHYKSLYDPNNFWNAVGTLKESVRASNGKLKVIPAGYPAAARLIGELAGGEQPK